MTFVFPTAIALGRALTVFNFLKQHHETDFKEEIKTLRNMINNINLAVHMDCRKVNLTSDELSLLGIETE